MLNFKGIEVGLPSSKIPESYIKPVVDTITGDYISSEETFTILKSEFEQTTAVSGLNAMISKLETLIIDKITENFKVDSDNFEAYSILSDFTTNQNTNEALYTSEVYNFVCQLKTYILKV